MEHINKEGDEEKLKWRMLAPYYPRRTNNKCCSKFHQLLLAQY